MRKYLQMTLLADDASGISTPVLMCDVIERLHHLFVRIKNDDGFITVGISFPGYDEKNMTMGSLVRLFGQEKELNDLQVRKNLMSIADYVHVSDPRIIPAPKVNGYVAYSRIRHDHNKDKLVRRKMKRHGLTNKEAEVAYAEYKRRSFPNHPFVLIRSKSTGDQKYPLYFKRVLLNEPGLFRFNTFGINPFAGVENF